MSSILDSLKQQTSAASDMANNAVSKAESVFRGGKDEALALIDAKTKSSITSLNNFIDEQSGMLDGVLKKISSGVLIAKDLSQYIDFRNGFSVDIGGLSRRLGKELGFPVDAVLDLSNEIKNEVYKVIDDAKNLTLDSLMNELGVRIPIIDTIWSTAKSISDVMDRMGITGDDGLGGRLVDELAQNAFLNVMVRTAVSSGMYTTLNGFLKQYTRREVGLNNLVDCTSIAIRNGDIYTIREIMNLCGDNRVSAKHPKLIRDTLMFFRLPRNTKREEWDTYLSVLEEVFGRIDVNWMVVEFAGESTMRLESFNVISDTARRIMQHKEKYRTIILVGGMYFKKDKMSLLREQYPLMAIVQPA